MSVAPTHSCFDDALDFLDTLSRLGATEAILCRYVVVHGICRAPDGQPFAHAWLEVGGEVVQAGIYRGERIYYAIPVAAFRESLPVVEETRYTVDAAVSENVRSGHYGPWVKRYRDLTGSRRGGTRVWDGGQLPSGARVLARVRESP